MPVAVLDIKSKVPSDRRFDPRSRNVVTRLDLKLFDRFPGLLQAFLVDVRENLLERLEGTLSVVSNPGHASPRELGSLLDFHP